MLKNNGPVLVSDLTEYFNKTDIDLRSVSQKECVLLAEDDAANLLVATELLKMCGYAIDSVDNGKDAVKKATTGNYRLAIMDIRMRDMDGIEATRRIREYEKINNRAPLPILCITAGAISGERERCLAAGMNDYLAKPFQLSEFYQKLNSLDKHAPRRAS